MLAHGVPGPRVRACVAVEELLETIRELDGLATPALVVGERPEREHRHVTPGDDEHAEPRTPQLGERGVLPVVGPDAVHPGMEREQGGPRDRVLQPRPGHPTERRGRARQPRIERADLAPVGEDRGSIQVKRLGIRATLLMPPTVCRGRSGRVMQSVPAGRAVQAVRCGPGQSRWDLRRCAAGPLAHHPGAARHPGSAASTNGPLRPPVARRYPCGCMHTDPSRSMSSDAHPSARAWGRARVRTRGCA